MSDTQTIETIDDAIGLVILCTDGYKRKLERVENDLGYYSVPIGEGAWMSLDGTRLRICIELFVGGKVCQQEIERMI